MQFDHDNFSSWLSLMRKDISVRRQIGLVLIGSAVLMLLVPVKDILILLLHREPRQAVLYIHIANLGCVDISSQPNQRADKVEESSV